MKEDITQPHLTKRIKSLGCGLVMKEDITQPNETNEKALVVVVW